MAHSASNRTGIVGAVNADAFLVKRDPHHAYRIPRPGGKHVEIAAAFAMLEHLLVVTKPGQLGDARTFQSPIGEAVCAEPIVTGYAAISFPASKTPSMFVFVSTFAETFLGAPLSPGVDAWVSG